MSTATRTRATRTKDDAAATARSAARDAATTGRRARATTTATTRDVVGHGKRVTGAAQAEVAAVAAQPTRPLMFTLGLVDRAVGTARELPGAVRTAPSALRTRVVGTVATAGDLAERAQRGYTEVARDGEELVASVKRQESTQRALRLADRARRRGRQAARDGEAAAEAAADATVEAVAKIG